MQTYTAKLKTRKQMERDIPRERLGWWYDVCPGQTLRNLRDATASDLERCFLREGSSKNPADYLCENFECGGLVSHEAVATLTPNASFRDASPLAGEASHGSDGSAAGCSEKG